MNIPDSGNTCQQAPCDVIGASSWKEKFKRHSSRGSMQREALSDLKFLSRGSNSMLLGFNETSDSENLKNLRDQFPAIGDFGPRRAKIFTSIQSWCPQ